MDLSSDQDLTLAIMNLVGIEEHFFLLRKNGQKRILRFALRSARNEKGTIKNNVRPNDGSMVHF